MMGQLEGLRKDMDISQEALKVIMMKIKNLDHNVENSEEKVETTVVLVLKEVFGLGEGSENEQVRGVQGTPPPGTIAQLESQQVVVQLEPKDSDQLGEFQATEMDEIGQDVSEDVD